MQAAFACLPMTAGRLSLREPWQFAVINTQIISGQFSTASGTSITVNWGDGTSNTYSGTNQAYSKDYGSAGNRTVMITDAKSNLTAYTMTQSGANVSFDLASLPRGLLSLILFGSNTVAGNLSSLPEGITYFVCRGANTVTGNLSSLPVGVVYFNIEGVNTVADYSERPWSENMRYVYHRPAVGSGLSTAEVDQLLIDLSEVSVWNLEKAIDLRGNNAPRSSASDAAVATLISKGVAVTTN